MQTLSADVVGWIVIGSAVLVATVTVNLLVSFFVIRAAVVSALAQDRRERAAERAFLMDMDES